MERSAARTPRALGADAPTGSGSDGAFLERTRGLQLSWSAPNAIVVPFVAHAAVEGLADGLTRELVLTPLADRLA